MFGLTMRWTLKASVSFLVLGATAGAVQAQQAATRPTTVAPQTAPVQAPGTQFDEITVTATKQEVRAVDALASVSVVTRQKLRQQQPQRIGTVLNQLPGVSTQENPNDPATAVNIRGLQDFGRVAVTVDGARQNFQRSGHNANGAFFLDSSFLRSVEVTRGPVANIYGSGAVGGVVSFETLEPRDILRSGERAAVEIGGTGIYGRQNGFLASAIGALRPNDIVEGLVGLSFKSLNPYQDGAGFKIADSGQDLNSGLAKVVITPADGHQIKIGGQYQKYEFDQGLGTTRRANDVSTSNLFLRYNFSRPDLPWLNLTASAYTTTTDTEQRRLSGTAAQIGATRTFKITTTGFDVYNTTKLTLGAAKLDLTYGVDYFEDKVTTRDGEPNGSGDKFTPSGQRNVFGGFFQSHLKLSIFDLIGGIRYDSYKLEGGTTSSDGQRISPKITLGITPIKGIQFYGTYAEGYRAPSITETLISGFHPAPATFRFVPNPDLKPEIGKTTEFGINLKYDDVLMQGDKLRGKASVFRNDVTNFIDSIYTDPGAPCGSTPTSCNDASFTYKNVSRARLSGVEAELAYDARRWFVSLSGSHIRGDNRIPGQLVTPLQSVYPDKLGLAGGLRFLDEKLVVSATATFVSAQRRLPASALATLNSKAYTLIGLNASYALTSDAKAFVTLDNVTDVRYKRYRDSDRSPGFVGKIGFSTRFGA